MNNGLALSACYTHVFVNTPGHAQHRKHDGKRCALVNIWATMIEVKLETGEIIAAWPNEVVLPPSVGNG